MNDTTDALTLTAISKSFGSTRALQSASFAVRPGEIHALIGENGAGKSTLIKIVTGVLQPDSGSGTGALLGEPLPFGHLDEVMRRGLSTVFQDLSLVPGLTVAANFDLGVPGVFKAPMPSERAAAAILEAYGIHDVRASDLVNDLSLGQRQRVEVARALNRHPRVLLLDEPTSALGRPDVEWLFEHLREQRRQGVAMVLISHRMSEIRDMCDRVTVLRNGHDVGTHEASQVSDAEIVRLMLGRSLESALPMRAPRRGPPTDPILEVHDLAVPPQLSEGTLTLREGEVLGLAGLDGQGQQQVLRALAGASRATHGSVLRRGEEVSVASPSAAIKAGIALVPGDRAREGLLMPMSVTRNMSLPIIGRFARRGIIDEDAEGESTLAMATDLDLDPSGMSRVVGALSGGNQQKVLLGKWLMTEAEVVLLDDPTQGVDVGTKHEIGLRIHRIADEGKGVILFSTDVDELVHLSDRVLVFYAGRVAAEFRQPDLDASTILAAVTGHAVTKTAPSFTATPSRPG